VLINRTVKEIRSEQAFAIHPSPYHDVWSIVFQFLEVMWILLGPEHNVPCSMASVYGTLSLKMTDHPIVLVDQYRFFCMFAV
jgi:hypothetical protein